MSDIYKLQYGGMTLIYPGWNGYLQYENHDIPVQRYELQIFKSDTGMGVSAGTVSQPFSAFDEIGVRCCYNSDRDLHGCNWLWFPQTQFSATTGNQLLNYMIANNGSYFIFQCNMNWNNDTKSFNVLNDQSTNWWGMISPINTNATIRANNNGDRHRVVSEIVGVKYQ